MSSRIKTFLFGRRSESKSKQNNVVSLVGQPYEGTVSSIPPIEGEHPIVGNGKITLDQVQPPSPSHGARRFLDTKGTSRRNSIFGTFGSTQNWDHATERPKTAPGSGRIGRANLRPTLVNISRPQSKSSSQESLSQAEPEPEPKSAVSTQRSRHYDFPSIPTLRRNSTSKSHHNQSASSTGPVSRPSHSRGPLETSHLDVLEAHFMFKEPQKRGHSRVNAYGLRSYGEDVADRNIAAAKGGYGITSPLPKSYGEEYRVHDFADGNRKARPAHGNTGGASTTGSDDGVGSTTITPSQNLAISPPIPHDSDQSEPTSSFTQEGEQIRNLAALPSYTAAITDHDSKHPKIQQKTLTNSSIPVQREKENLEDSSAIFNSPNTSRRRGTDTSTKPATHKRHSSNLSAQLSRHIMSGTMPGTFNEDGDESQRTHGNDTKKQSFIVKDAAEAPSLEGIVDLTNAVDTEVNTKQLPAVVHENLTQDAQEVRQEVITREIHTHDVYHRILPIKQTEILPAIHYTQNATGDGLVQIPISKIPGITPGETYKPSFQLIQDPPSSQATTAPRARATSKASTTKGTTTHEPFLSSKRHTKTKSGASKNEYIWRHPPTLEYAPEQPNISAPLYSIGDLHNFVDRTKRYSHDDLDRATMRSYGTGDDDAASSSASVAEGDLLFRDSGYGGGGMLPGLWESVPGATADDARPGTSRSVDVSGVERGQSQYFKRKTLRKSGGGEGKEREKEREKEKERLKERKKEGSLGKGHGKRMSDLQQRLKNLGV